MLPRTGCLHVYAPPATVGSCRHLAVRLVASTGIEPVTSRFSGERSSLLSYKAMFFVLPASPSWSQGVTVRAEESEVFYSVIIRNAVDVIKLQRKFLAKPFRNSTGFTFFPLQPLLNQSYPKTARFESATLHQNLFHGGSEKLAFLWVGRPSLAQPMSGVEPSIFYVLLYFRVVSGRTVRKSEPPQDFRHAGGAGNSDNEVFVRPCPLACRESLQVMFSKPVSNVRVTRVQLFGNLANAEIPVNQLLQDFPVHQIPIFCSFGYPIIARRGPPSRAPGEGCPEIRLPHSLPNG